jgi:hypothetical protein
MTTISPSTPPRFDPDALAALDEPVRRYLTHAIRAGAELPAGLRLTMTGRIKAGRWLAFSAKQEFHGHAFTWRARAGWGPLKPLRVTDAYRDGAGSTMGTLLGCIPFLRADDQHTARSAAGRAAAESIWVPQTLLPGRGVAWRAESERDLVARLVVPPEQPEVRFRIDATGALAGVRLLRWNGAGYVPFGGDVHAERRFGDLVLPSRVTVGWGYGTPAYAPFFEATILAAEPVG